MKHPIYENMAAVQRSNLVLEQVTHQNVSYLILVSVTRFLTTIALFNAV